MRADGDPVEDGAECVECWLAQHAKCATLIVQNCQ